MGKQRQEPKTRSSWTVRAETCNERLCTGRRKHRATGYLEREVFSHTAKRRDTREVWMKQKKQVIHEVNSNRGSSDLGHGKEGLSKRESKTTGLV